MLEDPNHYLNPVLSHVFLQLDIGTNTDWLLVAELLSGYLPLTAFSSSSRRPQYPSTLNTLSAQILFYCYIWIHPRSLGVIYDIVIFVTHETSPHTTTKIQITIYQLSPHRLSKSVCNNLLHLLSAGKRRSTD